MHGAIASVSRWSPGGLLQGPQQGYDHSPRLGGAAHSLLCVVKGSQSCLLDARNDAQPQPTTLMWNSSIVAEIELDDSKTGRACHANVMARG